MMNWLSWIIVVAMGYEVQGQSYSDRRDRGGGHRRGFPGLFCYYNNRRYIAGQSFPSSDGCNTCRCSGHNSVACTEKACLPNPPETSVCKVGQPHPTWICSNFGPVPFTCPDKYECAPNNVPGLFDAPGACCLKVETESVCKGRKQLPNRNCGGFIGRPCPRNYECVGHLLSVDGPGVCCPKDTGSSISICPRLPRNTMGTCVERCSSNRDCPRGQLCCSNGCGHVCMGVRRG